MAGIVVLDSGPLGEAVRPRSRGDWTAITSWRPTLKTSGILIVIPEIADYEVRRALTLAGSVEGLRRLDNLQREHTYVPLSTAAMRRAADLWAEVRRKGLPTAHDHGLDGDVTLAAQAQTFVGLADDLIVATANVGHLSRFLIARHWKDVWI